MSHGSGALERSVSLALVVGIHAGALWGLWQYRLTPRPIDVATIFVNFIAPSAVEKKERPRRTPPPKPKPIENIEPRLLVAETPIVAPMDVVAPPPLPQPVPHSAIEPPRVASHDVIAQPQTSITESPTPLPVSPVEMSSELAVACRERPAPAYPAQSRRLGEQGTVVLRVELDESGHVALVRVHSGSEYPRLDEAAMTAVRTWRCTPATRNGRPVRATAMHPIRFVLQGN